tara:strand:- start:350 stop:1735 length:1386 start_codon:yes stop_codon:yes gene_type:complete
MIKNIIFDLDGVIVDTRDIHFLALNKAIEKAGLKTINFKDHVKKFDGLPTKEKLKILNKSKQIPIKKNSFILKNKKKFTNQILKKKIKYDKKIYNLFFHLNKKYNIGIATNAIKSTLKICISNLKIKKFIKSQISNEEVKNPKPHPEMYMKVMLQLNAKPSETLILEDSHFGRTAVKECGANLMPIDDLKDVNIKNIKSLLNEFSNKNSSKILKNHSWDDKKLNIVIPMAGAGKRFSEAGYSFPKPLIEIFGKPMIQWVTECININANYIFLVQKEHQQKYNLSSLLNILKPKCKIVEIDHLTNGAASTVLLAKKFINNENPLIICNSDQYFEWNSSSTMYRFKKSNVDGGILCFNALHPKWSYAKCDSKGFVIEVAEKKVISDNATIGFYYWKHGKDYVYYANKMIKKNIRVNNEFYVCPVFNQAIEAGKKIITNNVFKMYGLGTPEDLNFFIQDFKKIK